MTVQNIYFLALPNPIEKYPVQQPNFPFCHHLDRTWALVGWNAFEGMPGTLGTMIAKERLGFSETGKHLRAWSLGHS